MRYGKGGVRIGLEALTTCFVQARITLCQVKLIAAEWVPFMSVCKVCNQTKNNTKIDSGRVGSLNTIQRNISLKKKRE